MDDARSQERRPGGNVEPLDRGLARNESVRPMPQQTLERFELHDPRSDVTYRTRTFVEMVTKANQIGAHRFVAISAEGERSTVVKTNGVWKPPEAQEASQRKPDPVPVAGTALPSAAIVKIDADAERKARLAQIEAALNDRYEIKRAPIRIGDVTIGQTEYRHRGDTSRVAFTESAFRLSTDNNNPSVARSMVDVAEARGWQALRVSGNEDFRRMVWLEASLRNVKAIGYEALPGDYELLRKERGARQTNRIEPRAGAVDAVAAQPLKQSERGGGGRKSVLAALEAVLVAKNVPERQREAVMAAAAENLTTRLKNGQKPRIKIYDKAAPSQREVVAPTREVQRDRDRGALTR